MLQLTWDTNCLITIESDEPHRSEDRKALLQLLAWHEAGLVNVRLVAGTAAEKQSGGAYLEHMNRFQERRAKAGLAHLDMLLAPGRFEMSFWDHAILVDEVDERLIQDLYAVMFPGKDYDQPAPFDPAARQVQNWRNRIIDAELYWSHLKFDGDLFVTRNSDDFIRNGRREQLLAFGGRGIEVPTDAVRWVDEALSNTQD